MEHKKVLLKLSGEALMGKNNYGHDNDFLLSLAQDIQEVVRLGVRLCIVVGGGNIYRGAQAGEQTDRAAADYIGMLATIINALMLQNTLESINIPTRVLSAIPMHTVCEPYIRRKAKRHMEKNRVVIFAGGTGNPFFTTDSAAVLRAIEMQCDLLLKGTQVDGVYDRDPRKDGQAVKFDTVTYSQVLAQNLRIMDAAAIAIAQENALPIRVFSIKEKGNIKRVLQSECPFTQIN